MNILINFLNAKDGAKDLGIELFQEVVTAGGPYKSGELKRTELGPEPANTYTEDMKKLYTNMKNPDMAFKLVDPNFLGIAGTVLKAHKAIVASGSPELLDLILKTPPPLPKGDDPTIALKGITTEGFAALLKYLYYGEKDIPFLAATELIGFCKFYTLPHLQLYAIEGLKEKWLLIQF